MKPEIPGGIPDTSTGLWAQSAPLERLTHHLAPGMQAQIWSYWHQWDAGIDIAGAKW